MGTTRDFRDAAETGSGFDPVIESGGIVMRNRFATRADPGLLISDD